MEIYKGKLKKTGKLQSIQFHHVLLTLFSFHWILRFPIQSCPEHVPGTPPKKKRKTPKKTRQKSQDPPPDTAKKKNLRKRRKRWTNPPILPTNDLQEDASDLFGSDAEVGTIMTPIRAVIRTSPLEALQLKSSKLIFCAEVWLQKYMHDCTLLSSISGWFEDILKFHIHLSACCYVRNLPKGFFLSKVAASPQHITRKFGFKCFFSALNFTWAFLS